MYRWAKPSGRVYFQLTDSMKLEIILLSINENILNTTILF